MYRYEVLLMKAVRPSPDRYGLICKYKQDSRWVPVAVAAPFSGNHDALADLAEKCTRLQLPPEHLIDIVSGLMLFLTSSPNAYGYIVFYLREGRPWDGPLFLALDLTLTDKPQL